MTDSSAPRLPRLLRVRDVALPAGHDAATGLPELLVLLLCFRLHVYLRMPSWPRWPSPCWRMPCSGETTSSSGTPIRSLWSRPRARVRRAAGAGPATRRALTDRPPAAAGQRCHAATATDGPAWPRGAAGLMAGDHATLVRRSMLSAVPGVTSAAPSQMPARVTRRVRRASARLAGADRRHPGRRPGLAAGQRGAGSKKLAEVARGSTLNLVGAAVSAATTLALTVLVTRLFSRPVAGAFFSATSLFLIIESVASLGAYSGVVYFIARLRLLGEEGRINAILRAAIIPVVVASLTGAALLLLFAEPAGPRPARRSPRARRSDPGGGGDRPARPGRHAAVRRAARHLARRHPRLPRHAAHGRDHSS